MRRMHEVEKATGIPRTTLQRYEKQGLINPGRSESRYREFSNDDMQRLFIIQVYKRLGYSLGSIKGMFDDPEFDKIKSLNEQRAELSIEIQRIATQIALIDYMKKAIRGEFEVTIEEICYLLCVYPEYRWVLETFGDPALEQLLEKLNPVFDIVGEWKDSVERWSKEVAVASARADGELPESEQDAYIEQVKQLLTPLADLSGISKAEIELATDLQVAKARGFDYDSRHVQSIIEKAGEEMASASESKPGEALLNYVNKTRAEKLGTLMLLYGLDSKEQVEFGGYVEQAVEHYIQSNKSSVDDGEEQTGNTNQAQD